MRKAYLMLLVSGLCLASAARCQEQDLLALTTNFGPRKPTPDAEPQVAPAPRPAPAVSPATAQSLQAESVRRQEAQIVGQQLITEGLKLYYASKYEAAIPKFEQALKVLPRAAATEVDYDRAVRGLSDCYGRMAYSAQFAGDKEKARQYARKALEYDPANREAENVIIKLKAAEQETVAKAERQKLEAKKPKAVVERPRLDKTPGFLSKQDEVRVLFREGRMLMNSGQYDEAEKRYKQILLIDHYNEDAYKNLQDLNRLRYNAASEGVDATRRQRLWQVAEAWIPHTSGDIKAPEKPKAEPPEVSHTEREKIEHKLRVIKFPEVSFRDAAIVDVVRFLSDESRKVDPEEPKTGVDIVLGPGLSTQPAPAPAPVAAPPSAPGAPAAPVPAPEPSVPAGGKTITLSLRNVPMESALKYVCSLAGLKYRVESAAVVLLPSDAPEGEMVTRSFNVSPDAIRGLLGGAGGAAAAPAAAMAPVLGGAAVPGAAPGGAAIPGPAGPTGGGGGSEDLKTFFTNAGVPFPSGSSLTYFERARMIYVRNTPEHLEVFEKVLETLNVLPYQVEIESKFVEISQSDLDELGFQWNLGPMSLNGGYGSNSLATAINSMRGGGPSMGALLAGAGNVTNWVTQGLRGAHVFKANAIDSLFVGSGAVTPIADAVASIRGFLNNADVSMVINALSQKRSADVLSAPKVTTMSGAQAQIRVVQEFIYPSEFSQPTDAKMPSMPTAFKTREVGVTLSVTPTVGADGYTINLTLTPEVSSFVGMLDYSPEDTIIADRIVSTGATGRIVPGGVVSYKIWQPLFETRNLTTSVVIWDGQTVVIGGLIREESNKIDDKIPFLGDIPFLGRLFRSKVSNTTKRNLLVFVTARLIDPAGNLIHRPDTPGFRFDPMGNALRGPDPTLAKDK